MKRIIRKVAVLGSGVMGSRIACHFAGIGVQVLLLDRVPDALTDAETKKKATLEMPAVRNRIVNESLAAAIKSNPSPLYEPASANRIRTGNFTDNLVEIGSCDWVIEVVVERLDIKISLFNEVERFRKPGTLITSNTSGIPIHLMTAGRTPDFKKHFCGTHFFNPPRYLRLLEIIPAPDTHPEVVAFLLHYGDLFLGKTTVLCNDTPAFIANRVGVYSTMLAFQLMDKLELTIDQLEILTGPLSGRPKSATFRTSDIVGIDTLAKVAKGVYDSCPDDESRDIFLIPAWMDKMIANNWLGDKSGQGFFQKSKDAGGGRVIQTLDLKTFTYQPRAKSAFATVEAAKPVDDLKARFKILLSGKDKAGEFFRHYYFAQFAYVSRRVPEISDEPFRIDDGIRAGFGWDLGFFEIWDALGVSETVAAMEAAGFSPAGWVKDMLAAGNQSFYRVENGRRTAWSPSKKTYIPTSVSDGEAFIVMSRFENQTVWKNSNCRLYHLGDEVLGLEWYSKLGTIGGEILEGIGKSIGIAEEKYKGLVIGNAGTNFSAGANVGLIFMMAIDQDFDELDLAVRLFQQTTMRARYSSIPVVVAPNGLTLGGACELTLHADKVIASAESYIGLVEFGVGLIPGGGGSKEFAMRASDEMHPDEPETITIKDRFFDIATAKVSTSAYEAYKLGILKTGRDRVCINPDRRIGEAKAAVLELASEGYSMPAPKKDVRVFGRSLLGTLYAGIHGMRQGNYATDHDVLVAKKLAYVMCGGDLSEPALVSEQYLLDLEREAFLSLCGEQKTLERIQSVLKTGKPLRN